MFDFLSQKFSSIFSRFGSSTITASNMSEILSKVKDAMLEADVPYQVVQDFTQKIEQHIIGQKLTASLRPAEVLAKVVHDELVRFLSGGVISAPVNFDIPSTIMVMGLQGSGKTTSIAKLAHTIQEQAARRSKKRKILLASVDFYRPAAIEHLAILAQKVGVDFYRSSFTDPLLASQDIIKKAKQDGYEYTLLDTAGRLHIDESMLAELQKIDDLIKPRYKILVLDAMTGQESLKIAQEFNNKIGFMGAILTKMDSETRGGAAFAFCYSLKKPLLYIGTGEKITDFEPFYPDRIAKRIMGEGDLQTLMEKAEDKIKQHEKASIENAYKQGKFTLEDFAMQLDMVNRIGSMTSLMKHLPGMGSIKVSPEMIEQGEKEMKKFKAIINSMTNKEKKYHAILDGSRKQRIAKGAGVTVTDVNSLLARFEQTQQFAKMMKKMGTGKFF